MKKLKKLLSLVLAMTMILSTGIFSVSAGAASYTDEKDIECLEAVQTLSELNIIVGKNDGSFDPNGIVTRAEMAKMLYVLANGGEDDGAKGYPDSGFTDIKGTWGENYINAAYALGLTAGTGNNQFSPNATITAAQVYKMLLNLIGYEDVRSGMTGSEWAQMALRLAVQTGLNEDVKVNYSEGMPRQYAAQAIYNAIDTFRVKLDDTGAYVEYDRNDAQPTVGERYLRLQTVEGVYLGNDEFSLDGEPESDGYIRVAEVENGEETGKVVKMKSNVGTDMVGQLVKVMYKSERGSYSTNIAYGMYATGDSTVEPFEIVDDYDVDDMNNKKSKNAKVFVNGALVEDLTVDEVIDGDGLAGDIEIPASANLTLIYNDGLKDEDGEISEYNAIAMITIPMLNEVTTLSSSTLTFADSIFTSLKADKDSTKFDSDKSFDLDDSDIEYDIADDVEVDDVVVTWYNCQSDVLHVSKAETVVGEVTGITGDGDKVRIDGETYDYDGDAKANESKLAPFCAYVEDDDMTEPSKIKNGTTYTLYLINGFYVAAEKGDHSGSSNDDYAVVTRAYEVGEELRLKLLTADGMEKTYYVDEFCGEDVDDITDIEGMKDDINKAIAKQPVVVAYSASDSKVTIDACNIVDDLNKYGDFDGIDELGDDRGKLVKGDDALFYKDSTGVVYGKFESISDKLKSSAYLDTEAAVFFDEGKTGEDWEAYEYADLDDEIDWSELGDTASVYVVLEDDDVVCLAVFAADDASPSTSLSGIHYGYLVKDPVKNKDNIEYTIWNGEEKVTYEQDESSATGAKHSIVAYTLDDDMIDDIWVITEDNEIKNDKTFRDCVAAFGYITDVSGTRVKINVLKGLAGKNADAPAKDSILSVVTTSDSTLMTIKAADTEGVAGTTKLRKNNQVIVLVNEDDEIEFAVIDSDGTFNKSAFWKANDIKDLEAEYGDVNSSTKVDVADCKHKDVSYAADVKAGTITATCADCKAKMVYTFTADEAEGVKATKSGDDLKIADKPEITYAGLTSWDKAEAGETYKAACKWGGESVEIETKAADCTHDVLSFAKVNASTYTVTCADCGNTARVKFSATAAGELEMSFTNNKLNLADENLADYIETAVVDGEGNEVTGDLTSGDSYKLVVTLDTTNEISLSFTAE